MNTNNISLLIHGPLTGNCIELIRNRVDEAPVGFNKIVVVSYVADYAEYQKLLAKHFAGLDYQIVPVKDLLNPGFANVNRQVFQMKMGLSVMRTGTMVIKNRNDQTVDFNKLFDEIQKYGLFSSDEPKLLTTNCYTRADRLYHPSDMFMMAPLDLMKEYFDYPMRETTEIMDKMKVALMHKANPDMTFNPISPESELFRYFLKRRSWELQESFSDSIQALKRYFYVLNSWDIEFRWNKPDKAGPKSAPNEIVLPHTFVLAPFPGAPVEHHRCYNRHEILGGFKTKCDKKYIVLSQEAWRSIRPDFHPSKQSELFKYRRRVLERFILNLLPFSIGCKRIKKLDEKISLQRISLGL